MLEQWEAVCSYSKARTYRNPTWKKKNPSSEGDGAERLLRTILCNNLLNMKSNYRILPN